MTHVAPPPTGGTPFDAIHLRLDAIDELLGVTTEKAATVRKWTREIRQALHVIEEHTEPVERS